MKFSFVNRREKEEGKDFRETRLQKDQNAGGQQNWDRQKEGPKSRNTLEEVKGEDRS